MLLIEEGLLAPDEEKSGLVLSSNKRTMRTEDLNKTTMFTVEISGARTYDEDLNCEGVTESKRGHVLELRTAHESRLLWPKNTYCRRALADKQCTTCGHLFGPKLSEVTWKGEQKKIKEKKPQLLAMASKLIAMASNLQKRKRKKAQTKHEVLRIAGFA